MTATEVAKLAGLPKSTISRFESGLDIVLSNAVRIADALDDLVK